MKKYVLGLIVLVVLFTNFSSADFLDDLSSYGSTIVEVILYVFAGIRTLVFGFVTILTSIYNIIVDFFNSGFFS